MKTVLLAPLATILVSILLSAHSQASGACRNQIQREAAEIRTTPYWQAQTQYLVKQLSGFQPRGCEPMSGGMTSRAEIFADDVEFLRTTTKFDVEGLLQNTVTRPGNDEFVFISSKSISYGERASLHVETLDSVIGSIDASVGSDAQCSPKVLLANVIAHVGDALRMRCGEGMFDLNQPGNILARENEERNILEGEE